MRLCQILTLICLFQGVEENGALDEIRERRSDFEISEEDERRRSKIGSLKKKAIHASTKFTHSLKKRGKKKIDYRFPPVVSIEDVRDEKEESVVLEFRRNLLERHLLPPRHDEYHTLLRLLHLACPSLVAYHSRYGSISLKCDF